MSIGIQIKPWLVFYGTMGNILFFIDLGQWIVVEGLRDGGICGWIVPQSGILKPGEGCAGSKEENGENEGEPNHHPRYQAH